MFSSDRSCVASVSMMERAPSINNGAYSIKALVRVIMRSIASGISTGRSVIADSTTELNRDSKADMNESAFSEIERATCSSKLPANDMSCGARLTTSGRMAPKTCSTIVRICGMYSSISETACGANCSMIVPIWSMSPPAPAIAAEKSPIRATASPLMSVNIGRRTCPKELETACVMLSIRCILSSSAPKELSRSPFIT